MPIVNPTDAMTDSPPINLRIVPTSCCQSLSGPHRAAETLDLIISKHFLTENRFELFLEMLSATVNDRMGPRLSCDACRVLYCPL
ncbi:hypothetical protein ASD02_21415 [Ensifer sp. Root1252]|nr:hypothetical protein ASD02_21415 [Ensifer sp. Root1252]KQW82154.1 hypothetical protein ASD03_23925 [Ensifer sp. Root127]KRC83199.1 hypothetical protein ASE32_24455 [Ensifer sp. Root231]KRC85072.1 hypothetical protein ASE47_18615 [Ensifer sp. Root258]